MSRSITAAALACLLTTLAGCAGQGNSSWFAPAESDSPMYTAVSPSANASQAVLSAAKVCCDSLAGLHFAPLDTQSTRFYQLDAASQAFDFSTGKSLLQAFVIPDDLERATLTLDAIAGATVFVPTVLLLDREFRVTRAVDSSNFRYTPAGFMEPQRLRGRVYLDRHQGGELASEKYLVVFTTDRDLRGSTRMISEARLYARARGLADPRLPDPVAQHAATGVFRLSVGELETSARATRAYVRQQRNATRYVGPATKPAFSSPSPRAEPGRQPTRSPGKAATHPPLLPETRRMYERMIEESVSVGDMDRAWRLVQEAERAGSATARGAFLTAVEKK
jgi:maltose operon periplasmic protein